MTQKPGEDSLRDQNLQSPSVVDVEWSPPRHVLVELTSLDELSFPPSSTRRVKYTCVGVSARFVAVGTSSGSVYVYGRYASKHRTRLAPIPVKVFTVKDGMVNTVAVSFCESLVAVGSESGRVTVASLAQNTPTSSTSSNIPEIIYTVGGDARHPDRVSSMCWSQTEPVLYVGHASGKVNMYKLNSRSMLRNICDNITKVSGEVVQMDSRPSVLLVSTPSASFVVNLSTKEAVKVGSKLRSERMGACFLGEGEQAVVLAARPNGRLWEANLAGTVYRTHQLRQCATVPVCPIVSFRVPFQLTPLEQDPRTRVAFQSLYTLRLEEGNVVLSVTDDGNLAVVDVDGSPPGLVLLTSLQSRVSGLSIHGSDLFVLFSDTGALKKFTLFPVAKALEKLVFKEAFRQAANLWLSCGRDIHNCSSVVQKIEQGLKQSVSQKDSELAEKLSLAVSRMSTGTPSSSRSSELQLDARSPVTPTQSTSRFGLSPLQVNRMKRESQNSREGFASERLSTGIHRVVADQREASGYEDDFDFHVSATLRERSRSSPKVDGRNASTSLSKCYSVPVTTVEREDCSRSPISPEESPMQRAEKLLESSCGVAEKDSLRAILGLDPETPVQDIVFEPTVTWANAPRALAELTRARAGPLDIAERIEQDSGSERPPPPLRGVRGDIRRGARIVKTVRPSRGVIVGRGGRSVRGVRPASAVVTSSTLGQPTASPPIVSTPRSPTVPSTSVSTRSELREENSNQVTSQTHGTRMDSSSMRHHCPRCSMHRSWVAAALLTLHTGLSIKEGFFSQGGVPSCWSEWRSLLVARLGSSENVSASCTSPPCSSCHQAIERFATAIGKDSASSLRPHSKCLPPKTVQWRMSNIEDSVFEHVLFGKRGSENNAEPVSSVGVGNNGRLLSAEKARLIGENDDENTRSDLISSHHSLSPFHHWIFMVDVNLLLSACISCIGLPAFRFLAQSTSAPLRQLLPPHYWTTLAELKAAAYQAKQAPNPLSNKFLQSASNQFNLTEYATLIQNTTPTRDVRTGIVRRLPGSLSSSSRTASWTADLSRSCPVCTLSLRSQMTEQTQLISFPCGHSFHSVCLSSNNRSISKAACCVACRARSIKAIRGGTGSPLLTRRAPVT